METLWGFEILLVLQKNVEWEGTLEILSLIPLPEVHPATPPWWYRGAVLESDGCELESNS